MKILNEAMLNTATTMVVRSTVSATDINKYRNSIKEHNIDTKKVLWVGLFDKAPATIGKGELQTALQDVYELLKVTNIHTIVDEVGYFDVKTKKHKPSQIFAKILNKDVSLWKDRGVHKQDNLKWICGFRADAISREMNTRAVVDTEFVVDVEKINIIRVTDDETAKEIFKKLHKEATEICFDTETRGAKFERTNATIYTVQLTDRNDPYTSYVFYPDHPKVKVSNTFKETVAKGTKWLLESGKKIYAHNFGFDATQVMRHYGVDIYKVNAYCTMNIYHFLTNTYYDVRIGLKESAFVEGVTPDWETTLDEYKKQYCRDHKIKDEEFLYEYFDVDDLELYAGLDTIVLAHYVDMLEEKSRNHPAGDIIKITWEDNWQSVMQSIWQMTFKGVPFDLDEAYRQRDAMASEIETIQQRISEDETIKQTERVLSDRAWKKALAAYDKKVKDARAKGKEFKGAKPDKEKGKYGSIEFDIPYNDASPAHKATLILDVLALPVIESNKTSGSAKLGEEQMNKYFEMRPDIEILNMFNKRAKLGKSLNTYILPWIDLVENSYDGRLHSSFNPTATSLRLRSFNPNLLNITARGDGSAIKKCISGRKDGKLVLQTDYAALEERIALLLHKDPVKLKFKTLGVSDPHSVSAIIIDEATGAGKLKGLDKTNPDDLKVVKKEHPDLRQNSKKLTFGVGYLCSYNSIKYTFNVSDDIAKGILNTYWDTYKTEWDFIQGRVKEASENGYVLNFGNAPLLTKDVTTNFDDKENMNKIRPIWNSYAQSAAFFTLRAMDKFMRRMRLEGLEDQVAPFLSVYDSIILESTPEQAIYARKLILEYMVEPFMENQAFPLEADCGIGYTYKPEQDFEGAPGELEEILKQYKI